MRGAKGRQGVRGKLLHDDWHLREATHVAVSQPAFKFYGWERWDRREEACTMVLACLLVSQLPRASDVILAWIGPRAIHPSPYCFCILQLQSGSSLYMTVPRYAGNKPLQSLCQNSTAVFKVHPVPALSCSCVSVYRLSSLGLRVLLQLQLIDPLFACKRSLPRDNQA